MSEYKVFVTSTGVTVKIYTDGSVRVTGNESELEKKPLEFNSAKAIWDIYKNYRSNDTVIRSGSGLCGVYRYDPKHPKMNDYRESDTLHSTTVEELARNIFRFYPALFTVSEQKRIVDLLRYHDLGETVDNPDDGSKDKDEKFEEELETFITKVSSLVPADQERLIRDFVIFEHAGLEIWSEEDKRILQFAKLCDKTDAPLGALIYELQDRHGSLKYKKDHFGGITAQDQRFADEIGEYSQSGIWTAHMIDTYLYYADIEIFIEIIIEACKDVRGEVFPWLYEFCKKRGISENLLSKM